MPGTFSPTADFEGNRKLAIPACITARAWRTCRDACRDRLPAVAGKTFPAFPAHAHPQFCVSGKRPIRWRQITVMAFELPVNRIFVQSFVQIDNIGTSNVRFIVKKKYFIWWRHNMTYYWLKRKLFQQCHQKYFVELGWVFGWTRLLVEWYQLDLKPFDHV